MTDEEYIEHIQSYAPNQLEEALRSLDKEKYPQRVRYIQDQLAEQKIAGEFINHLIESSETKKSIPLATALAVWWAFTWRTSALTLLLYIPWLVVIGIYFKFGATLPRHIGMLFQLLMLIMTSVIGIFVMRSILGKTNYRRFRITIGQKNSNNRLNPTEGS